MKPNVHQKVRLLESRSWVSDEEDCGVDGGTWRRVDSFEVSSVYVLKKCCFEEEGIALVLTGLTQLTNLGCEWLEEEGR